MKTPDKLTSHDKKRLLVELIETMVENGYDLTDHIGKPLSYYNYEAVEQRIVELKERHV